MEGLKVQADGEARWLEGVERIIAIKGGGYFPVLVRLRNGELVAVVRGGAPHVGVGGKLDLIKSKDGGRSWSQPKTVAGLLPDSRNPAFGRASNGRLVLAFALTGPYQDGRFVSETGKYTAWLTTSEDGGETWTKPQQMDISPLKYASPYGKIVQLSDGTLLMNIYTWSERGRYSAYIFRSTDNGKTWKEPNLIAEGFNETGLAALPGDKVLAAMRTDKGGLAITVSIDGGRTWGEPKHILESGCYPADLIRLQSGNLLLTYGHRIIPYGVQCVISKDGGQTWDLANRVMLEWDSANADCGYPSSVQLDDGTIVTIYYGVQHNRHPDLYEYAICVRYREDQLATLYR